jgi:hypothetical protein
MENQANAVTCDAKIFMKTVLIGFKSYILCYLAIWRLI